MQELTLRPAGLQTDPSPLSSVAEGALEVAQNSVIRREGIIAPRNGFEFLKVAGAPGVLNGFVVYQIMPFDGDLFVAVREPVGPSWKLIRQSDQMEILDETGASLSFNDNAIFFATSRDSLYFTCADGIRKLTSATSNVAPWAGVVGMPPPIEFSALFDANYWPWLPYDNSVAYRTVLRRTDENGYIRRGPPSGRRVYTNPITPPPVGFTAASVMFEVIVPPSIHVDAGDVIEIYRTRSSSPSVDPGDTMYLAGEIVLTSGDISAGVVTYIDGVVDDALGAALYSNETQQGILQANYNPPLANDVCLYAGMMFYANTTDRQRFECTLNVVGEIPTGFGTRTDAIMSGDFVAADPNVTNVSPVDQASVNQLVVDFGAVPGGAGATVPAGRLVSSITSSSAFVMNGNASATNATHSFALSEQFNAGAAAYSWSDEQYVLSFPRYLCVADAGSETPPRDAIESLAAALSSRRFTLAINNLATITVEQYHASDAAFEVYASHGASWTPDITRAALPVPNSTQDVRPNRIYYSKQDEPEAVPLVNFVDVGSQDHPIYRILVARDSLLVLKTDGIFRITGTNPFDLRVDELDTTASIIHPKAAARLRNMVYAWTDRGVVRASDVGTQPMSNPVIQDQLDVLEQAIISEPTTLAVFAATHETENEFVLGVPPVNTNLSVPSPVITSPVCQTAFIFNGKTNAWTTWVPDQNGDAYWGAAQYNPANDRIIFGGLSQFPQGTGTPEAMCYEERKGQSNATADYSMAVTVSDVTGNVATISNAVPTYLPLPGDCIIQINQGFAIVTESISTTQFRFAGTLAFDPITPVAGLLYVAFESRFKFTTKQAPNAGMQKHWRDATMLFESLAQFREGRITFSTDYYNESTGSNGSNTLEFQQDIQTYQRPKPVRTMVTRDQARASRIGVEISIKQACSIWRLSGLSLIYEPMNERVRFK